MIHLSLIQKIAWSFHRSTGLEIEDLIQEASIAYVEAMKTYDKRKGAISTYIWHCVQNHLTNYIQKEKEYQTTVLADDSYFKHLTYTMPIEERLPMDALKIAKLILKNPIPYVTCSQQEALKKIVQELLRLGWGRNKIIQSIKDIKFVLS